MDDRRAARLVETVLRCYPARWRHRHGDEAAELAALLIADGTPAASIAWSYLAGAAREWLIPRAGQRLSTAACALLGAVCSLSVSAGLLASAAPAKAAPSVPSPPITAPSVPAESVAATPATTAAASPAPAAAAGARAGAGLAACRPVGLVPIPGARSAVGGRPVVIWTAGHERAC
jgi:hypothetical protein